MPGEAVMVTLSRPFLARTPKIAPRTTPGLSSAGRHAEQETAISSARSNNLRASTPMMAAGTMPKSDSAEYRPPMLGSP